MREIVFLILFSSISVDLCFSDNPVADIVADMLIKSDGNKIEERIVFLANDKCRNLNGDKTTMYVFEGAISKAKECLDTIGFMPINENKVKVFLKVDNSDTSNKVSKVSLYFKEKPDDPSEKLVISCNAAGDSIGSPDPSLPIKVTATKDNIDLSIIHPNKAADIKGNMVQCKGFDLEEGTETLEKFFERFTDTDQTKIAEWRFEVIKGTTPVKYIGKHIKVALPTEKVNIFTKMRCDPEKLIPADTGNDNKRMQYYTLEKDEGVDETMANLLKMGIKTYIDSVKCQSNGGARMMYEYYDKSTNAKTTGLAKSIVCKEDNKVWGYVINDLENPTEIKVPANNIINVWCIQRKCRMCKDIDRTQNDACQKDDGCKEVEHNNNNIKLINIKNINTCKSIKTNECKIMKWNNRSTFTQSPVSNETSCNDDSEYIMNNEHVTSMSCANYFPITLTDKTSGEIPNGIQNGTVVKTTAVNCTQVDGCKCMPYQGMPDDKKQFLAIVNTQKKWMRIESLKFNNSTGIWTYTRNINKDQSVTNHSEISPIARCVGVPVKTPEDKIRYQAQIAKNEGGKTSVYVVNIVLIAVFAAVVIPSVIFYVNARIKKREALKAAKKDKKKEDKKEEQSGDKKSDEKKPDEKKNEA